MRIIQVTPAKLLQMYTEGEGSEYINIKVGTEQRIYCRLENRVPCAPNEKIVVYAVV